MRELKLISTTRRNSTDLTTIINNLNKGAAIGSCFYKFTKQANFNQARSECRSYNGDLIHKNLKPSGSAHHAWVYFNHLVTVKLTNHIFFYFWIKVFKQIPRTISTNLFKANSVVTIDIRIAFFLLVQKQKLVLSFLVIF